MSYFRLPIAGMADYIDQPLIEDAEKLGEMVHIP